MVSIRFKPLSMLPHLLVIIIFFANYFTYMNVFPVSMSGHY